MTWWMWLIVGGWLYFKGITDGRRQVEEGEKSWAEWRERVQYTQGRDLVCGQRWRNQ